MNRWKWLRRLLLYPLLTVGGCHTLLTGSPIPLWHLENLESPVPVSSTTEDQLVLKDGREITLPFIKRIPHDNPLFKAALAYGIEVTSDGEALGLMWSDRFCGNDPVTWRRLRINLSNLAGALNPEGVDPAFLDPDWKSFLVEGITINLSEWRSSHDRGHLAASDWMKMRKVRKVFDYWAERQKNDAAEQARRSPDDEEK